MLPSPDILNNYEHGKFVLTNLAAKRAKQLREGAPPLVRVDSSHPLTIALAEIAAGKIKPILSDSAEYVLVESPEIEALGDVVLPSEFGLLLPALDETEVAIIASGALHEDEIDSDIDEDGGELSISDLVTDDEEDAAAATSDDDTLSLTSLEEEETASMEEESEE